MFELPNLTDDGLPTADVGAWAEEKYRLIAMYGRLFTKAMRGKRECLVYVDLFAGCGRGRVRGTNKILPASPTIALSTEVPFDKYIFCEADPVKFEALRTRCGRDFGDRQVHLINGDANAFAEHIVDVIPRASTAHRVLTFCLVDPYAASNLAFDTIRAIAKKYVDFLVLIPTNYDIKRNQHRLLKEEEDILDRFLGGREWRERWEEHAKTDGDIVRFVVDYFSDQVVALPKPTPYIKPDREHAHLIKTENNLRLYRLLLYSTSALAERFWKESRRYTNAQTGFDFSGG